MHDSHKLSAVAFLIYTACGTDDSTAPEPVSSAPEPAAEERSAAPATVPSSNALMDAAATPMPGQHSRTPWQPMLDAGPSASDICSLLRVQLDGGTAAGDCVIPCRPEWEYGVCKRPNDILVQVDGRTREQEDPADGWHWGSDLCTVILVGAACEDLHAGRLLEIYARCAKPILC